LKYKYQIPQKRRGCNESQKLNLNARSKLDEENEKIRNIMSQRTAAEEVKEQKKKEFKPAFAIQNDLKNLTSD